VTERALPGFAVPPARTASPRRSAELTLWLIVALAILAAVAASTRGVQPAAVLAVFVVPLVLVAGQRVLLAWQTLLGLILAVILFIPIRRYTIGGGLPIELEPYRVLIATVLGCWFCALAADPKVKWRSTGFAAPVITLLVAILGSLVLNLPRVNAVSPYVIKQLTFFGSYLLVVYFVTSVVVRGVQLDRMLKLLVGGAAVVACFALYEWRTGINYFNDLHAVVPFLHYQDVGAPLERGTGVRAWASAQHSIALGAGLVMMLPLAVYLYKRTGHVIWLAFGMLLTLATLSTGSRTAAVMLIVTGLAFLVMKRAEAVRMLPYALVMFVAIQAVMPGTLGTFKGILKPSYVIKEQSKTEGTGAGRLADLGPSLSEWSSKPLFGQGFGTRIVDEDAGVLGSQQILDNQWLGTLLEIGAVGFIGFVWLFGRAIRRLAHRARLEPGPDGWLPTCLAASLAAFTVGMFTFDAFAFIQVTFFAFILLGFAAVVTRRDWAS
jgi:polysaccharide biosynthesis protein PslJ